MIVFNKYRYQCSSGGELSKKHTARVQKIGLAIGLGLPRPLV